MLRDAAAVEHQQALGKLEGFAQVVRDQYHRARLGGLQTQKLLVNSPCRVTGSECSERLVQQKMGGFSIMARHRPRTLLLLPSGEFVRVADRVVP